MTSRMNMMATTFVGETRVVGKDPKVQKPLTVTPTAISFEGIQPGVLYVMTFAVRNNTLQSNRIRITAPKTKYFALNYVPCGSVAPGLDLRAEIECQLPETFLLDQYNFNDSITVSMGPYSYDIPLYASRPGANIVFDPLVNFGYVADSVLNRKAVTFKNTGVIPGVVTLRQVVDDSKLRIDEKSFKILPDEVKTIEFVLDCVDVGPYRELIQVDIKDSTIKNAVLDVMAEITEQKLVLLTSDNKGILDKVDFGSIYYGQATTISAFIVNTGPKPLSYSISYLDDDLGAAPQTDGKEPDIASMQIEKFMQILPSDGVVKPFSHLPVLIRFTPELPVITKGFAKQHSEDTTALKVATRKAFIESVEIGQKFGVTLEGSVSSPHVTLSPSILKFGSCAINERRDIAVVLTNHSNVPSTFDFKKIAHYKITPSSGELQAHQSRTLIASFLPSQFGKFKSMIPVTIAGGVSMCELKLVGDASETKGKKVLVGGVDKTPADFETRYNFVDPAKVREERLQKTLETSKKEEGRMKKATSAIQESVIDYEVASGGSRERDAVYGFGGSVALSHKTLASNHPLEIRRANDKYYNEFLQTSQQERLEYKRSLAKNRLLARGANDRSDPSGVDMGMDRGLDEPTLKNPLAGEPLWLANRPGGAGGNRSKMPTDENRLIQKKFSDVPATQAEMRDCETELDIDQLKSVAASHKLLDFGKVCATAMLAKNFTVTNELDHSVLVRICDLEPEIRQSKPAAQVIPAGATAGFDIYFTSKTLGMYKKSFTWTINGKHMFKVTVAADVVPIELVMNKTNLVMEFPDDSVEPSLIQDVILSNPGNAVAEFLWGSGGAFVCQPEKGNINPGQAAMVSIIWTPVVGKRNDEELGLHVSGGVDQTLSVAGKIVEAKCSFEDKVCSIGTVAVGTEKVVECTLRNSGSCSAVFFVDGFEEKYGISVNPMRGVIPPGETVSLECQFIPREALSYDNLKLTAAIRGGKTAALKLSGESIIPVIDVMNDNYSFGTVTTGSQHTLPFTVANKSSIAATLILDLSSYPDFFPRVLMSNNDPTEVVSRFQEDHAGNKLEVAAETEGGDSKEEGHHKKRGKGGVKWKVTLQPGAAMNGSIAFTPRHAKTYAFKLPLNLLGISDRSFGKDVSAESTKPRMQLSSPAVDFGDRVVSRDADGRMTYFMEVAISNIDQRGFAYELREEPPDPVIAEVERKRAAEGDLVPPIFFIAQTKGTLGVGMSTSVRVSFSPQMAGDFHRRVDVYLTDQSDESRPYMILMLRGSGVYPKITFDCQSLALPTVPLGISSKGMFTIFNNGYSNVDLKYRLSPTITIPLELSFPDGQILDIQKDRIRVIVAARADAACSWVGKVEFSGADGEKFYVNLSGCSDGCLLTTYSFVRTYSEQYGFLGLEGQPVQFLSRPEIAHFMAEEARKKEQARKQRSLELQKKASGAADKEKKGKGSDVAAVASNEEKESMPTLSIDIIDGIDLDNTELNAKLCIFDESEAVFLLKWLNRFVCRKPFDAERFPDCILESHGDLVIDCVEQMSGAKIAGAKEDPPAAGGSHKGADKQQQRGNQREAHLMSAQRLVQKYKALLSFLTRYGALVNHVDPINLLGLDDYLHVQESELRHLEGSRLTHAMLQEWKSHWMNSWHNCCSNAWLDILFQVVKVYSFARINFKTLSNTPGVSISAASTAAAKEKGKKGQSARASYPLEYAPSNIFTHAESCLLEWASQHIYRACKLPDEGAGKDSAAVFPRRLIDLDQQLGDLYPLCQVMHSHLPDATKEGGALKGYSVGDRTKREANFARLNSLMAQYRLDFGVNDLDITTSGRTLLVTLLHLFLNLPCLIPKTKIEFRGYLGLPMMKSIELKNPSKKKICYAVTLAGSKDFTIGSHDLVIPAGGAIDYPVTMNARFAESSTGVITFTGVREAGVAGATMVFGLESFIVGRKPVSVVKKACSVFELEQFVIDVKNPFDRDMNFSIKIMSSHSSMKIADAVAGKPLPAATRPRLHNPVVEIPVEQQPQSPSKKGGKAVDKDDDRELEEMHKNAFWCKEESLQIPGRSTRPLTLNFLPLMLGTYCCHVIFTDKNSGEFCYEVEAEAGLPLPSDSCEFSAEIGRGSESVRKALRISSRNSGFERALQVATDVRLTNPGKKQRLRTILQNLIAAPVTDEESGMSNYIVEIQSPYFNCLKALPFVSEYVPTPLGAAGRAQSAPTRYKRCPKTLIEEVAPAEGNSSSALNSAFFNFMPERPGIYKARAVVYSKDNAYDVRICDISGTVTLASTEQVLEFRGPARQSLTQDIPIRNEGGTDWSLQAHVAGRGFSGAKALAVPRGGTATYTISFAGPFVGSFEGTLQLKTGEGETFEYKLLGFAEEPLAEGNLHLKCNARAKKAFSIPLKQVQHGPAAKGAADAAHEEGGRRGKGEAPAAVGAHVLAVQTDIPYLIGASEVEVPPGGSAYDFSILSPVGGLLVGSITFTDRESGAVTWFAVEVDVTSPQAESVIAVESVVRKAVAVEISLINPTQGALQFSVVLEGEGVIGDSTYTLPGGTAAAPPYELIYSPLVDGRAQGRISFINDSVGEFWYRLDLSAIPAAPTVVDSMEAMVGSSATIQVPIDNPLADAVTLAMAVSNPDHFSVDSETITLEAYAQSFFNLTFRPSSIGELAVGDVVCSHPSFGNLHYKVSGLGQLPGNMPAVHMAAPLGETGSHAIPFRNPFAFPLPVDIVLSGSDDAEEGAPSKFFSLLLRKATDIVIPPRTLFQISLGFTPSRLGMYNATLQLRSSVGGRSLLWCFPLTGVAEAASLQVLDNMSTPCKTSLIKEVRVPLEGLMQGGPISLAHMSQQLLFDDKVGSLVSRSFRSQFIDIVQLSDDEAARANACYVLKLRLLFEPLKELLSSVEIVLELKNRGRWRARVQLEATEPEPDDTIRLTAAVGGVDKVAFRLSNRFLGFSTYQAYFTAKSSVHFAVSPSSGVLEPYGSEGTPFVITFAPLEYGSREYAQLVVVTDDTQWNFDCVGMYPDVSVNNLEIRSKIDSGIHFR